MSTDEKKAESISDVKPTLDVESITASAQEEKFEYTQEEKRLKFKIDRAFLPLIFCILFVQFVDKSALNFANTMGILQSAHLDTSTFGWLGSFFYIGYLVFQVPNHYLVQRLPISKYMGVVLCIWGTVFMSTSQAKSFGALAATRILLGFFEAVTYPCVFILISMFYRRHEQLFYIGYMFVANAISIMFGALIAYGIQFLDGRNGLAAWQYLYLIWGSITFFLGFLFFLFLPDTPKSRWFYLTAEEETIVDERLKDNGQMAGTKFNKAHIFESLREGRYYAHIAIAMLCNLQNGCTTVFSTQIIREMGFNSFQSILLNIPNGACGVILITITTFSCRRFNEYGYVALAMTIVSTIGVLLLAVIPSGTVRLLGIYLTYACTPIYILNQTMINNNVKGFTKKAFFTGSQLIAYSIGNFFGPTFMMGNQGTRYLGGMLGFVGANVIVFILFVYIRWSTVRDQRLRKDTALPSNEREINDLTDREDLTFTYRQ
ncbi:major facilitator superfamily domain-containing protein [Gongronella butleri]|nr:major facilitator superfamily domain-containing protein [Gongronella butleri]